ncbi:MULTISPECIES: hypothetical protein [unclassified Microbacterium]|uniref:hypothetical protein n=1 Tax=unclassified Microbacterium TaxID=2609290 RepID=UPI000CFE613E|nr:hypothetical protein [Microbacterium sp. MYb45]PRB57545.1 hypothetical protein CQ034_17470 [Microbacterium sp. MYb45]
MSDLTLESSLLDASRSSISAAIQTFANADRFGDDVAGLTGHSGLSGKVQDFAGNWDRKRGQLQKSLEGIRDTLQAIADTFGDLDRNMAKSVTDGMKHVERPQGGPAETPPTVGGGPDGATEPTPGPAPGPSPAPAPAPGPAPEPIPAPLPSLPDPGIGGGPAPVLPSLPDPIPGPLPSLPEPGIGGGPAPVLPSLPDPIPGPLPSLPGGVAGPDFPDLIADPPRVDVPSLPGAPIAPAPGIGLPTIEALPMPFPVADLPAAPEFVTLPAEAVLPPENLIAFSAPAERIDTVLSDLGSLIDMRSEGEALR